MSLYLCIFDDKMNDIDGVDIGSYADFARFREYIYEQLESRKLGSRFPILMVHSDSDGEWNPEECRGLTRELETISEELKKRSPVPFGSKWQMALAKSMRLNPTSAYESFIDVDGDLLLERLAKLAGKAAAVGKAIVFQ